MQLCLGITLLAGLLANYGVESITYDCRDERDCSLLIQWMPERATLDGYCNYWRNDPAVSQCRSTCQFCKPYAPECKDEMENCKNIAAFFRGNPIALASYCQQNKDNPFAQKCKETCKNHCIQDVPFPPQDCKDEVDVCSNIVRQYNNDEEKIQSFCQRFKKDPVLQKCKRTCRLCHAEAPKTLRIADIDCEDESTRCKDIVSMHKGATKDILDYCKKHQKNPTVKKCKKTCGTCISVKAPHQPQECEDESDKCYDIVYMHKGDAKKIQKYCERHQKNPTVKKCKKTCPSLCNSHSHK